MLRAALVLAAMLAAGTAQAGPATLETPGFSVQIEVPCPEGEVVCERVRFTGIRKRDGERTELQGRTLHAACADRAAPCRLLGWQFERGDTRYVVSEQGELLIEQAGRVLVREVGRWAE